MRRSDVSIRELLQTVITDKDRDQVAFETYISDSVPDTVWTDRLRMQQILRNAMSNAVKFSRGHDPICVYVKRVGGSNSIVPALRIEIRNKVRRARGACTSACALTPAVCALVCTGFRGLGCKWKILRSCSTCTSSMTRVLSAAFGWAYPFAGMAAQLPLHELCLPYLLLTIAVLSCAAAWLRNCLVARSGCMMRALKRCFGSRCR